MVELYHSSEITRFMHTWTREFFIEGEESENFRGDVGGDSKVRSTSADDQNFLKFSGGGYAWGITKKI